MKRSKSEVYAEIGVPSNTLIKNLKRVMSVQSHTREEDDMIKFITSVLKGIRGVRFEVLNKNIYVKKDMLDKKGNPIPQKIYPGMAAHTDTVHSIHEWFEVFRINNDLFAMGGKDKEISMKGIGGDDKVGIFITLEMLKTQPFMKAVFFWGEETGCLGSRSSDIEFWDDVGFILQCDRRDNSDFIRDGSGSRLYSDEFSKHIAPIIGKYGYAETSGLITDVVALKERGLSVCVANMSCGYYNPHGDHETVNILDIWATMLMCQEIFETSKQKIWSHKPERSTYSYNTTSYHQDTINYWENRHRIPFKKKEQVDGLGHTSNTVKKDENHNDDSCRECNGMMSELSDRYYCVDCGNFFAKITYQKLAAHES